MLERAVEKHLVERVEATGGIQRKVVWPGRKGAPDRLVGWPTGTGVHVFIELKRPKGPDAEAHQKREHKRLRDIGFDVRVIHTKEQVDEFILEMTT